MVKDGVQIFFDHFGIDEKDFIQFGISNIDFPNRKIAAVEWQTLLKSIRGNRETIHVRKFGRVPKRQKLLVDFYKDVLKINNITFDTTNNAQPYKVFSTATDVFKRKHITNYKVSHIWGRTKNPYAFCALWNMCYTPIFIDPFTGHEANGILAKQFQKQFKNYAYKLFRKQISEFNAIMQSLQPKINQFVKRIENSKNLTSKDKTEIKKVISSEFACIEVIK